MRPSLSFRRGCWSWLLLLAAVAGCGEPDPDETVYLYGPVTTSGGDAVRDAEVQLQRAPGCESAFRGGTFAPPARWETFGSQTSDQDGNFVFPLKIGQVSPRFTADQAGAFCFRVSLAEDADGSSASITLLHNQQDIELLPLVAWRGAPSTSVEGENVRLHPGEPPPILPEVGQLFDQPGAPAVPLQLSTWEVSTDAGIAFRTPADGRDLVVHDLVIDPEMLEDFGPAQARLITRGEGYHQPGAATVLPLPGYGFVTDLRSVPAPVPSVVAARVPVSRHAPCELAADAGVIADCPYTDGRLDPAAVTPPYDPSHPEAPTYSEVTIRLDAPRSVRRVVVHGLDTSVWGADVTLVVEGSLDQGATWSPITVAAIPGDPRQNYSVSPTDHDLPVEPPVQAQWVRLSATVQNPGPTGETDTYPVAFFSLSELSIFE